jgi:hypothetical protein
MEGAVPQAVDLPQGFVAMDESFESFDPPGLLHSYSIVYADPMAVLVGPPGNPSVALFDLALFDTAEHAHSVMVDIESLSPEEMQAELWSQIGGATELQPDSLTIEEVEPAAGVGDEAVFIRARVYERPAGGSGEFYIPRTMDVFTLRRGRLIGEVVLLWTPGPPGQQFVTENLAKKLDAGIQAALPQLQAAVP